MIYNILTLYTRHGCHVLKWHVRKKKRLIPVYRFFLEHLEGFFKEVNETNIMK